MSVVILLFVCVCTEHHNTHSFLKGTYINICLLQKKKKVRNTEVAGWLSLWYNLPTNLSANTTGKELVFELGKTKIEQYTALVHLTLFNEAPAVRHGGLNPTHSNICC